MKISVYVEGYQYHQRTEARQYGPGGVFTWAFETMQCDCPSLLRVEDARLAKINLTTGDTTKSCHQVPILGFCNDVGRREGSLAQHAIAKCLNHQVKVK